MRFHKFIKLLIEGGNVKVPYNGSEVGSDKIQLTIEGREKLVNEFKASLKEINKAFKAKTSKDIWQESSIDDNSIFAGSARIFFDLGIKTEEFINEKPEFSDLDTFADKNVKADLYKFLQENVNTQFKELKFIGFKQSEREYTEGQQQYNTIFEHNGRKIQFDFVFIEMKDGKPLEFDVFSRNATLEDIKAGIKGVFHKYLLRSLVKIENTISNVLLMTPGSIKAWNAEKPKSKEEQESFLSDPKSFKISKHKGEEVSSLSLKTFSALYGIRDKYAPLLGFDKKPVMSTGKNVYYETPPESCKKDKIVKSIYKQIFKKDGSEEDLKKFESFLGLVSLMKDNLKKEEIEKVFNRFLQLLFGTAEADVDIQGQGLSRDNPEIDKKAKSTACGRFVELIPELKSIYTSPETEKMVKSFYATYKIS